MKKTIKTKNKFKSYITWKEANPNKNIIGDITNPHVLNNVLNLVGKIIKDGINDQGFEYFNCIHSRHWLEIVNLDLSFIKNKVSKL